MFAHYLLIRYCHSSYGLIVGGGVFGQVWSKKRHAAFLGQGRPKMGRSEEGAPIPRVRPFVVGHRTTYIT